MQKKWIALITAVVLTLGMTACAKTEPVVEAPKEVVTETPVASEPVTAPEPVLEKVDINIAVLKGPTGMGMVQVMENNEAGEASNNYTFEVSGSPDDVVGKIISGELDIAAVPTNLALVLYNKTQGAVQLAAVNTLGVLYVLENGETIQSIADLKDKTLNTSGKGASPDYIIQYLLKENGLTPDSDVMLDYKLEHADLAAALVAGDVNIALLPQPHVTTALMKNPDLRVALDITKEWNTAVAGTELAMGVIIVQKAFAEAHPEALNAFLDEYKASIDFVNSDPKAAAALIEKQQILPSAAVAEKAIPLSSIVYRDAIDAKASLEAFYKVLFDFEPKSVGGKLADEGFYYNR